MSNIAIIGAGFSGLALCYHLLMEGQAVTVFDGKGIGGGASGIASGLMHPYPGESARLSWNGLEGMQASQKLLKLVSEAQGEPVYKETGILRLALTEKQEGAFRKRAQDSADVEWWDEHRCKAYVKGSHYQPGIFIRSGITVHSSPYLEGLWQVCADMGARLIEKNVQPDELTSYDQVVIAAGGGIRQFKACEMLNVKFNKGQILACQRPHYFNLEKSLIGKGYVALSQHENLCYVGSTYEHDFITEQPCLGTASELIFSQIGQFLPAYSGFRVQECLSGMRVVHRKSYHPIAGRLDKRTWIITGMGSRGLLYHSYLGKKLAGALVKNDDALLPKEVCLAR